MVRVFKFFCLFVFVVGINISDAEITLQSTWDLVFVSHYLSLLIPYSIIAGVLSQKHYWNQTAQKEFILETVIKQ